MNAPIGTLRERVVLQRPSYAPDEFGGAALSWADQGEVWAAISAGATALRDDFGAPASTTSGLELTINARDDVRVGWRAVWGVRVLRVIGVRDDGGPRVILDCQEDKL